MEGIESLETQGLGQVDFFSPSPPKRFKLPRKYTVNVQHNHSMLDMYDESEDKLTEEGMDNDAKVEAWSNDENIDQDSFNQEQNAEILSRQMLENTKLVEKFGGYSDFKLSQSRIVTSKRSNKKREEMSGYLK